MKLQGRTTLKGAIFFSLLWLLVCLVGGVALLSCSHTSKQANGQDAVVTPADPPAPGDSVSGNAPFLFKRHARRSVEEMEAELGRGRDENKRIKEENNWLHLQVIQLEQDLVTANQNIYSLNRKLDAIFKPN